MLDALGPDCRKGGKLLAPDSRRRHCSSRIATLCFEPVRLPELLGISALTVDEQRHDYEKRTYTRSDNGIAIAKAMERASTDRFTPGPLREIGSQSCARSPMTTCTSPSG